MLILQSVGSPRDQKNLFAQFEPETHTWLVSDLRSKLDLNRSLLANRQFISGESVLRASELWKLLLSRTRPDLQFVSREFALALIGQKLPTFDEAWLNSPGAPQTAYDYISQLMPVLAHPEGESIMQEWLTLNVQSQVRWGRWFDLALKLWREFLEDGLVAPPWALGVLVNEVDLNTVWSRPLIVDLGAELNQVEADLLILLAGTVDVVVLCPEPDWKDEYSKALKPYEIFESKIKIERRPPPMSGFDDARENFPEYTSEVTPSARPDRSVAKTEYFKYTTMIAEVKDAVARVRGWLDQVAEGALPQKIAIAAPDIEVYWPALASYLETEGIPTQKDHVRRLHSYPDISRWLAHLRLRTGAFAEADLETGLFASLSQAPRLMSYERFRTLYTALYDRQDLARAEEVNQRFAVEISTRDSLIRDDFVAWSLRQLPEEIEFQRVESLLRQLF
jgi:ATP-dependent helicase/nuclease subunit B